MNLMTSDVCCDNMLVEMPELTKIGEQFLNLWTHHQLCLQDLSVWAETLRRDSSKGSKATIWLSQDEHMAGWAIPRVSEVVDVSDWDTLAVVTPGW